MDHIQLARKYAMILSKKLDVHISNRKLEYITLAHDLFKERALDASKTVTWKGYNIPQDLNRYVRTNLNILEEYGLDEFFNTDVQLHPLAAGIFLNTEFGVKDKEILYPIFFHSCPIISVYETLTPRTRHMVDVMMLADKLSSNYLRINSKCSEVRTDLDLMVFGPTGKEFNYTLGLFVARLISQGRSQEIQSLISTDHYHKRLCEQNPLIGKGYSIKKLGGSKVWPKRKSQLLRMP